MCIRDRDLTKVKSKVLFNLTKRQLVCFGGGALIGVPLFFLLKEPLGNRSAAICMIVAMMPFFLFALYEKMCIRDSLYPPSGGDGGTGLEGVR